MRDGQQTVNLTRPHAPRTFLPVTNGRARPIAEADRARRALELLEAHYQAFQNAKQFADMTGHTVPSDTKSWSEILVGILAGLSGRNRKKGTDLADGSDVKGANTWAAIDTPRFNGAIPAGRTSAKASKPADVRALDGTPFIFFVLWDEMGGEHLPRCRIWVVQAQRDEAFRAVCAEWYAARERGEITSTNFQLHPPRNLDADVITNTYGHLRYPLFFAAVRQDGAYRTTHFDPDVLVSGRCTPA